MQVRVLPIAQQRRECRVERCESHKVVKGQVERSMKEDGKVIRKRRCDVCGDLMRTIEMTEDQLAYMRVKFEDQNRALRAEMVHYKAVAAAVKGLFAAEERVRKEITVVHEIPEEDQL